MSTVRLSGDTSAVDGTEQGRSAAASRPLVGLLLAGILASILALSTETAVASHPDGASPGLPPGMSEAELREAETAILGPEHAAEHAQQRAVASQLEADPADTATAGDGSAQFRVVGPPAQVGQWGAPFEIPTVGIHAALLPTGKVMWWSNIVPGENTAQAWLWDPSTGATKRVDPPILSATGEAANIWCSGQSLLADGRVLVTGGNLAYPDGPPATPSRKGLNKVYTFNPFNETWTEQPDMPHGRWYPGQVSLPDGRTLIISGLNETGSGDQNPDVDLFTPSADLNGQGTLTTIATRGGAGQPPQGGLYPHMFVMPSGRTLVAGPQPQDSWFVDQTSPFSWSQVTDFAGGSRRFGSGVLMPGGPGGSGIAMLIGGGTPAALGTSVRFDESSPSSWSTGPSLQIPRTHHNTVLLPDGSMATVGGGVGNGPTNGLWDADEEQKQVELYDPATQTWRLGASQQESRAYHSTALLLPDGRVLSAGDEVNGASLDAAEIYEPPYLFNGPQPAITSAPDSVAWGDDFGVYSPDAISRAVLMAPGATTHGNDMNQRHVELQVTGVTAGVGVNVAAPPSSAVAPPGYYMLFLLNQQGVPSAARWVKVDPSAPDRPPLVLSAGATLGAKAKSQRPRVKRKKLILPIKCVQPEGVDCAGEIAVTAKVGGGAAIAKRVTLAAGSYSVPSGTTREVKLKLSKRGMILIKRKGKLKATVTLTNSLNGVADSFKVKI